MSKRTHDADDHDDRLPKRANTATVPTEQPVQCTHCSRNAFGRMLKLKCRHNYHLFCYELLTETFGADRCMRCFTDGSDSCGTIVFEWDGPDAPS